MNHALLTADPTVAGLLAVPPLESFFEHREHRSWLVSSGQVASHKDHAQGYLEEAQADKGRQIFWQAASPKLFQVQGGVIPGWVEARMGQITSELPEGAAIIQIEYLLDDPFALARCSQTGTEYHFALWDGMGNNGAPRGEVAFDWDTILPARLAAAARRDSLN